MSDLERLRGDPGTQELLEAEAILAPTTAGEFLRKFDIGDVQDLHRMHLRLQHQVRAYQQSTTCTIDLDSSIYEQCSTTKEGSTKAYNGETGYHPLLAFWAEEGGVALQSFAAWQCLHSVQHPVVFAGDGKTGSQHGQEVPVGGQRLL